MPKAVSLSSPIAEKIAWARNAHDQYGKRLLSEPVIYGALSELKAAVRASREEMNRTGVGEICRICEVEEGGSCCGAGLENRYDGWLLLINRLLGITLPTVPWRPEACFFLGRTGCLLWARHVICINYLCKKITHTIPSARLKTLRQQEGVEIEILFALKERIKTCLKKWTTD